MTHLETELAQLGQAISDMIRLTESQLNRAKSAIQNNDAEVAEEILARENRLNAMELSIDRDCENIFAIFQPVATDLRYVLSMLKINADLERMGDHAAGMAKYILNLESAFDKELLKTLRFEEMFDLALSMVADVRTGIEEENTNFARKVFAKDATINKINADASKIIAKYITANPENAKSAMFLFSTIRKIERIGDLTKNIAEDLIFYLEAKVLKHSKKKT